MLIGQRHLIRPTPNDYNLTTEDPLNLAKEGRRDTDRYYFNNSRMKLKNNLNNLFNHKLSAAGYDNVSFGTSIKAPSGIVSLNMPLTKNTLLPLRNEILRPLPILMTRELVDEIDDEPRTLLER